MPNRIIRESSRWSRNLAKLSNAAARSWWSLNTVFDDFGRYYGDEDALYSAAFPVPSFEMTREIFAASIVELVAVDCVRFYERDGRRYVFVPSWNKHQRTRSKLSRFPDPDDICCHLTADVAVVGVVIGDGGESPSPPKSPSPLRLVHQVKPRSSPPRTPAPEPPPLEAEPPQAPVREEPPCHECLAALRLLNELTCRTYDAAGRGMDRLHACHFRYGLEPVLAVIRDKVDEWGQGRFHRHLNPLTLFHPDRFDAYRNALLGPVEKGKPALCPRCRVAAIQPGRELCWPCANPRAPVEIPKRPPEASA